MKQPVKPFINTDTNINDADSVQAIFDSVNYRQQTDISLMQQYAAGDLGAFETLYNRHKGGL